MTTGTRMISICVFGSAARVSSDSVNYSSLVTHKTMKIYSSQTVTDFISTHLEPLW